jgi:glycosyltransferase involved in cell wall biosynthesis
MKLAYFVNQYPKVSHSFIRREILALEALGYKVERYALRTDKSELVDETDLAEVTKTRYLLATPKLQILFTALSTLLANPVAFIKTAVIAINMGRRSDRGLLLHLIYLIEGCELLTWQKTDKIDHVHAHFGTNSTTVVMFARLLGGASYSFTVHGPEEFDKPEFIHLPIKIKFSRFVVAISSYGRSQLLRWIPFAEWPKVNVVHCGLDDNFLMDLPYVSPGKAKQFVCVGRLCEQKGQLILLDAMKRLKANGIECRLVLAGDGPMRIECETMIKQYQLHDRVSITGWISSDQVKTLLMESSCMVLPSFAEGLPVVIMEAMALKRPVISTFVAGIPELIESGRNGWLIPAGDVDKLTHAMTLMLNLSAKEQKTMGEAAYTSVKSAHDIHVEAAKLAELISPHSV